MSGEGEVLSEVIEEVVGPPCDACGKPDALKPMCFRGERYCCDLCRKRLGLGLVNPKTMKN